jgi:hypothetical protein
LHAAAVAVDAESANDMRAVLTGVYASPVGCLCTYDNVSTPGQIAPSIHQPATAYGNTYNYFDPDNFFALTALMASGDPFLIDQTRAVIERSGAFLHPGSGQVPHHFEVCINPRLAELV